MPPTPSLATLPRELRDTIYSYLKSDATLLWSHRPTPLLGPFPSSAHITLHATPIPSLDLKLGPFKREYENYSHEPCRHVTIRIGANLPGRKTGKRSGRMYAAGLGILFEHVQHVTYFIDCGSEPHDMPRSRVPAHHGLHHWNMVDNLVVYLTLGEYALNLTSVRVALVHSEECVTTRHRSCFFKAPSCLGGGELGECVQRGRAEGWVLLGKEQESSVMEWYAFGDRVWDVEKEVKGEWRCEGRWGVKWREGWEIKEKREGEERVYQEGLKTWKDKKERLKEQRRVKKEQQKEKTTSNDNVHGEKSRKRKRKRKLDW